MTSICMTVTAKSVMGGIDRDFWDCDKPCPIVEIPVPHDRLIDESQIKAVELEDSVHFMRWERGSEMEFQIDVPTVIEAEGRNDR